MTITLKELEQLKADRTSARDKAIIISKRFTIIKKVFYLTQAEYKNKVAVYNKLDRKLAFALFEAKKKKLKPKKSKPYNANKRIAAKALKALKSLPEKLRAKVIDNAKDGLF